MRRLYTVLGWLLVMVSVVYLLRIGVQEAAAVARLRWGPTTWVALAAATILYMATLVAGAAAWTAFLRVAGQQATWRQTTWIVLRSSVAKYLPGNVGHYIGRVVLGKLASFKSGPMLVSLVLEGVLTTASGLLFVLLTAPRSLRRAGEPLRSWIEEIGTPEILLISLGVAVLVLAVASWWGGRRAWTKTRRPNRVAPAQAVPLLGFGVALLLGNFVLLGAGLTLLARGALGTSPGSFWWIAPAFATAWIAGFVTPGSPGGLGVREAVLVTSLGLAVGPGPALGLALLSRLATMTGDGLAFLATLGWSAQPTRLRSKKDCSESITAATSRSSSSGNIGSDSARTEAASETGNESPSDA